MLWHRQRLPQGAAGETEAAVSGGAGQPQPTASWRAALSREGRMCGGKGTSLSEVLWWAMKRGDKKFKSALEG